MGEVWLAQDTVLDRGVAIKQLLVANLDEQAAERMAREARTIAQLDHPNIVGVHDLVTIEGHPFLVMQFIDGESLADRLRRLGRLSSDEAVRVFAPIADALALAHRRGIVHRDIKPSNILIGADGQPRLADFGIARSALDAELTSTGQVIGTLAYMPPDLVRGERATAASDVWSLGATLYAALEGCAPFGTRQGESTAALLFRIVSEAVPAPANAGELAPVVMRTLSADPRERPDATTVHRALTVGAPLGDIDPATATRRRVSVVNAGVADAAPTEAVATPSARRGRTRTTAAVVGVAAVVVAAVVWVTFALTGSTEASQHSGATTPPGSSPRPTSSSRAPSTATGPSSGTSVPSAAASSVSTRGFSYRDPTYGYSFTVGSGLLTEPVTSAAGATSWTSKDGRTVLSVTVVEPGAGSAAEAQSAERGQLLGSGASLTYQYRDGDTYVLSGYDNAARSRVFYTLAKVAPTRIFELRWTYPTSQLAMWRSDNEITADTFRAGP